MRRRGTPSSRPTPTRGISLRWGIVAGLVTMLTIGAPGVASALWTASDTTSATAKAATVGVTQSVASSPTLGGLVYSSTTTAGVGSVTVTNTSSRAGTYSLVVSAPTATAAIRGAVAVEIGTAASCTTTATLASAASGTLAGTTKTGSLAAGQSVTLCVRTSMTSANISANAGASFTGSIQSSIAVGTWSASATAASFAQSVQAAAAVGNGWYFLWSALNPALCLEAKDWGSLIHQDACSDSGANTAYNELWRFAATSNGYYRIQSRINSGDTQWYVDSAAAGQQLRRGTDASTRAEWSLTPIGSGQVQIALRANPALCVSIAGASASAGAFAVLAACSATATSQRFTTDLLEIVVPPSISLQCAADGGGYNVTYSWPQLNGYQNYVVYRVKVDGVISTVHGGATGWDTNARFSHTTTVPAYAVGVHSVTVEQSVMDGPWTVTGTGTLRVGASAPLLGCS